MGESSFLDNQSFHVDKLTHKIFSLLKNKFLFGSEKKSDIRNEHLFQDFSKTSMGKVSILSIDGAGSTDGILAAESLVYLESCLCQKFGDPNARIADFFDVATGCGVGGVLAALLFTKGKEGHPIFKASEALQFVTVNRSRLAPSSAKGVFGRIFRSSSKKDKVYQQIFGESTLKDTLKPVLIPCYDLSTRAPFLFSRTDAMEDDSYDFKMSEVCAATLADLTKGALGMLSVDKKTRIAPVDGGVAMNNPTAAAITHVLNNKQEFPFCERVEDLLVVSMGNGISNTCPLKFVDVAGEAASSIVDESVSMAFGKFMTTNYLRVQANGTDVLVPTKNSILMSKMSEQMLRQKNVESILFRGKKIAEQTNSEKLECFAGKLIKEQERRKLSTLPMVMFKNSSPRSSSATVSTESSY